MSSATIKWSLAGWLFRPASRGHSGPPLGEITRAAQSGEIEASASDQLVASDRPIVAAIRQGDARAFAALFDATFDTAMAVAYRLLQSRDAAQDVVQQVFAMLWEHRKTFRPRQSVRGYLLATVRHQCIDLLRRTRRERVYEETVTSGLTAATVQDTDERPSDAARVENRITIAALLATLPARRRYALELRFLEQLSYEEVAEVMGVSVQAAKHLVARSLDELQAGKDSGEGQGM